MLEFIKGVDLSHMTWTQVINLMALDLTKCKKTYNLQLCSTFKVAQGMVGCILVLWWADFSSSANEYTVKGYEFWVCFVFSCSLHACLGVYVRDRWFLLPGGHQLEVPNSSSSSPVVTWWQLHLSSRLLSAHCHVVCSTMQDNSSQVSSHFSEE